MPGVGSASDRRPPRRVPDRAFAVRPGCLTSGFCARRPSPTRAGPGAGSHVRPGPRLPSRALPAPAAPGRTIAGRWSRPLRVALEVVPARTFAVAVDWPGWTRGGRDEEAALDTLLRAAPRYATAGSRGRASSRRRIGPPWWSWTRFPGTPPSSGRPACPCPRMTRRWTGRAGAAGGDPAGRLGGFEPAADGMPATSWRRAARRRPRPPEDHRPRRGADRAYLVQLGARPPKPPPGPRRSPRFMPPPLRRSGPGPSACRSPTRAGSRTLAPALLRPAGRVALAGPRLGDRGPGDPRRRLSSRASPTATRPTERTPGDTHPTAYTPQRPPAGQAWRRRRRCRSRRGSGCRRRTPRHPGTGRSAGAGR